MKKKLKLIDQLHEALGLKFKDYINELTVVVVPGKEEYIATDIKISGDVITLIHHSWDEHPHSGSPMNEERCEAPFIESNADEAIMYLRKKAAEAAADLWDANERAKLKERQLLNWCGTQNISMYELMKD